VRWSHDPPYDPYYPPILSHTLPDPRIALLDADRTLRYLASRNIA